jgi:hypothetical protein
MFIFLNMYVTGNGSSMVEIIWEEKEDNYK